MTAPAQIHADLPHDDAIEHATLAALLLQPQRALEDAIDLTEHAFFKDSHRVIFKGFCATLGKYGTADLRLLVRTLQEGSTLDSAGGEAAVSALLDVGAKSANIRHYVGILRELEGQRAAIYGAEEIAAVARGYGVADVVQALRFHAERLDKRIKRTELLALDIREALTGEMPAIPWLADGWLGRGDLCIFGGEWGTGKSVVAMDLAVSVAAGIPWMGRIPVQSGSVAYIDEENNPRNSARRIGRMIRGRNLEPLEAESLPLHYLCRNRLNLDDQHNRDRLRRELDATKPALLILDSLIRFHSRDENKNTQMAAFFAEALAPITAEFGCAIVALDHMSKPNGESKDFDAAHRIRGAGDKAGVADTIWTLEGDREADSRTLAARKNRWEDTLPPAISTRWRVSEDETAAWIEASDAQLNAEVIVVGIVAEAEDRGILASPLFETAEARGIPRRTAIRTVKRLRHEGTIEHRKERGNRVRYWSRGVALRAEP